MRAPLLLTSYSRHHAVALTLGLAVLATVGGCTSRETPTGPSPDGQVVYGVVGASDAIGFGGSVVCQPFDAACNGTGYAYLVKRRFESDGATVQFVNRGLPGAVLSPAMLTLARDSGRSDIPWNLVDNAPQFLPPTTTHISVFTGGNDANVIAQAVRAGRAGSDVRAFVDQQVQQFGTDLQTLVSRLRAQAPNARLVFMNLPNLAAAPYVAGVSTAEKSLLQRISVGLTDRINALSGPNLLVVDLMCESRIYQAGNYSADGFHPSDQGYALMADLLYPALRTGTAPAPSPACAPRTFFPN